ncbi:MAG: YraN family protein [Candidatus Aminicenantes bacterium]|nr:YraN family protein [Candidatus Aminicenantes bacterium]
MIPLSPFELGKAGESAALNYLQEKKFKIIETGFRFHRAEIDIIASHKNTLVFIEVKTRRTQQFGFPEESISVLKQNQIRKAAQGYLIINKMEDRECRFDVLSLLYDEELQNFSINHYEDAF